jgi:hypothetical protein
MFGPPEIILADGTVAPEPPSRVLQARYVDIGTIQVSPVCAKDRGDWREPTKARIQLKVSERGLAMEAGLVDSTGDACKDEIMMAIAGSVWYQWLPGDRFVAPVELIQPLSAMRADL